MFAAEHRSVRRVTQGVAAPRGEVYNAEWMCLAIPAQVVEIADEVNRLALVDVAGVRRKVNVGLLDAEPVAVEPGDWVLVHVGFAIAKIDEREAAATRQLLHQMGAEYEQELEELKASVIE